MKGRFDGVMTDSWCGIPPPGTWSLGAGVSFLAVLWSVVLGGAFAFGLRSGTGWTDRTQPLGWLVMGFGVWFSVGFGFSFLSGDWGGFSAGIPAAFLVMAGAVLWRRWRDPVPEDVLEPARSLSHKEGPFLRNEGVLTDDLGRSAATKRAFDRSVVILFVVHGLLCLAAGSSGVVHGLPWSWGPVEFTVSYPRHPPLGQGQEPVGSIPYVRQLAQGWIDPMADASLPTVPVAWIEAVVSLSLGLWALPWVMGRRGGPGWRRPGHLSWRLLGFYGLVGIILPLLRNDAGAIPGFGIYPNQLFCGLLLLCAAALLRSDRGGNT